MNAAPLTIEQLRKNVEDAERYLREELTGMVLPAVINRVAGLAYVYGVATSRLAVAEHLASAAPVANVEPTASAPASPFALHLVETEVST